MNIVAYSAVRTWILFTLTLAVFAIAHTTFAAHDQFTFTAVAKNDVQPLVSSVSTKNIKYTDVRISDIYSDAYGDIANTRISLPENVEVDGSGVLVVPEIEGILNVKSYSRSQVWVDKAGNFMSYDQTQNTIRLDKVKDPDALQFKIKKGYFHGSKTAPLLVRTGYYEDMDVYADYAPGETTEIYNLLVYNEDVDEILGITLAAPRDGSKSNQKVWTKLLKSIETKKGSGDNKSTKATLTGSTYKNAYFSVQLPKGWVYEKKEREVSALSKNAGITVLASVTLLGNKLDYDPDMHDYWVTILSDFLEQDIDNFKLLGSSDVKLGGLPALRIDHEGDYAGGIHLKGYQVIAIDNGTQYMVTVVGVDENQLTKHADVLQKTLRSFKKLK